MASIKKRNNKYCVVYRFIDADGKKKQKCHPAVQDPERTSDRIYQPVRQKHLGVIHI